MFLAQHPMEYIFVNSSDVPHITSIYAIIAHRIAVFLNAIFICLRIFLFCLFFLYNVDMYCKALLNTCEMGAN